MNRIYDNNLKEMENIKDFIGTEATLGELRDGLMDVVFTLAERLDAGNAEDVRREVCTIRYVMALIERLH